MLLQDKVAVIHGAGGSIGAAVARTFAREGAHVFLTGRSREPVELVAKEIDAAGGAAECGTLDVHREDDVERFLRHVVGRTGRLDVSFDATGHRTTSLGPLVDLPAADVTGTITAYAGGYFTTARMAAREMSSGGVILSVTALPSRWGGARLGGFGAAQAAKEALGRLLSLELAASGIRVVNLRPNAIPESRQMRELFVLRAAEEGTTTSRYEELLTSRTHTGRLSTLAEVAETAAFLASDRASGLTGTTVNLSLGSLDD